MIGDIYNLVLFEPLFNALVFIYNYIPNLGVAIVILTLIIKFILYIPSRSSITSQKRLQETQPKLKALQEKYKDNKEELGRQLMKFYKDNKVNPFSSCLPLLLQLPILIALYRVFLAVAQTDPNTFILVEDQIQHLYEPMRAIFSSKAINPFIFGEFALADLSKTGNFVLAVMAGAAQFWQSKMLMSKKPPKVPGAKDESMMAGMNKQMMYFMPLITVFFAYQFPAGLALYWFVSTLFSALQQLYLFRNDKKPVVEVISNETKKTGHN